MRKLLNCLYVIQVRSNAGRKVKYGRGFSEAHRLNPLNPISYVFLAGAIIVGLILFGVIGFWKEEDLKNPFKWS